MGQLGNENNATNFTNQHELVKLVKLVTIYRGEKTLCYTIHTAETYTGGI